jgi:hypothetical protein
MSLKAIVTFLANVVAVPAPGFTGMIVFGTAPAPPPLDTSSSRSIDRIVEAMARCCKD